LCQSNFHFLQRIPIKTKKKIEIKIYRMIIIII
jgi:hypothetical protein